MVDDGFYSIAGQPSTNKATHATLNEGTLCPNRPYHRPRLRGIDRRACGYGYARYTAYHLHLMYTRYAVIGRSRFFRLWQNGTFFASRCYTAAGEKDVVSIHDRVHPVMYG